MKWDIVGAGKQSKLYDFLPHDNITYQFAVAANTESTSSGMAWATCTLIHGKGMLYSFNFRLEDENPNVQNAFLKPSSKQVDESNEK